MNLNTQASVAETTIKITTTYEIKNTLARAAALHHQPITTFLLEAAFEQAKRVLQECETITLSNTERERFFALLETSDEPNDVLKTAMNECLDK